MTARFDTNDIIPGMQVIGPVGEEIGRVKEVRGRDFLLDLTMRRDLYVPFSAVEAIEGTTVALNVRGDEVGDQGWEPAPLLGEPGEDGTAYGEPEDRVTGIGDPTERGAWSPAADAYDLDALNDVDERQSVEGRDEGGSPTGENLDALDTTGGRQPIEGTDDGEQPRAEDTGEFNRLRDMSG